MGILDNFLKQEERRIERLFEIVERFAAPELDGVIKQVFEAYAGGGFMGRAVLETLKMKIAKVCGFPPASKDAEFLNAFAAMDESKKRCLLVTIANDCCKLGVLQEADVLTFLETQLAKNPAADTSARPPAGKTKGRL